jgi:hypothetical protein
MIQSSAKVGVDGAVISAPSYAATDWYRATVPSTVVGALVDGGVYKDPFFGMNLRDIPGTTFKIGANFVHTAMDPASPYAVPWWYRTTFRVPASMRGRRITLNFDGINYRANIWLNGHQIAAANQRLLGTWVLADFQPEVPLEPMLAQLLSLQMGRLTADLDGGRLVATGPGVQATRTYRIDQASMDRFKLTLFDETGVSYEAWGDFQGDVVRFESLTTPWRGRGALKRAGSARTP